MATKTIRICDVCNTSIEEPTRAIFVSSFEIHDGAGRLIVTIPEGDFCGIPCFLKDISARFNAAKVIVEEEAVGTSAMIDEP